MLMATLHRAGTGLVFVYSTPALMPHWLYVTLLHYWAWWSATATVKGLFHCQSCIYFKRFPPVIIKV